MSIEKCGSLRYKTGSEIRSDAWRALGESRQYLRFAIAVMLLEIVREILNVGMLTSCRFLAPGRHLVLGVHLMLLLTVLYFMGYYMWGMYATAIAVMRHGLTFRYMFSGWGHGWRMLWIAVVAGIYLLLWSFPLIVPGLVKFCSYAMTWCVAVDHPDWSANRCIAESCRMMNGRKWGYFCMLSGFMWWVVLVVGWNIFVMHIGLPPLMGTLALCLLMPYITTANAAFYEDLLELDAQRRLNLTATADGE